MPSTYKTPGVYVEEISIFPPSVASVETAVPAFIGYTEKANKKGESLSMKPTRIKSMVEFEEWFGSAPPRDVTAVLDDNNEVVSADSAADFFLYDSLRMYFANGGGKCYIVSVGTYRDGGAINVVDAAEITEGLVKLEKEDEPTIIVSPDAALLTSQELSDFQKAALVQCNKLQDRVVLCDTVYINEDNLDAVIQDFRDKVGIQYLKYGAAYTPWLKTSLQHNIKYRNLSLERDGGGTVLLKALTNNTDVKDFITDKMDASITAVDTLEALSISNVGGSDTWTDRLNVLIGDVNDVATGDTAAYITALNALYGFVRYTLGSFLDATILDGLSDTTGFQLKTGVEGIIVNSGIEVSLQELVYYSNGFKAIFNSPGNGPLLNTGNVVTDIGTRIAAIFPDPDPVLVLNLVNANIDITVADYTAGGLSVDDGAQIAIQGAKNTFKVVSAMVNKILAFAQDFESTFDTTLSSIFGTYKNILASVNGQLATLPPSSTIAGVYAAVDADRGVWKAPANVSLNNVIGPSARISQEEQAELNVDVNAGKSINAIRAFTGKGILVWGARTLAGNDNEWRYVSVRRFYNMVEESVKKSSGQFVFEPNDANTWVKVKGMIENYLTVLWRQGALAGAKTSDAFFVKVGLGETMTAQDILEGRMIVEIGMAVVRPAEFIILKFSHKMQES